MCVDLSCLLLLSNETCKSTYYFFYLIAWIYNCCFIICEIDYIIDFIMNNKVIVQQIKLFFFDMKVDV